MSATVLKLIPVDPRFVPPTETHKVARELLHDLLPPGRAYEIETEVYESVTYIEAGENTEAVLCPACGTRNSLYDCPDPAAMQAWAYWVFEPVEDVPLEEFRVDMKCCGAKVEFMKLKFDWPAGFARFELFVWDPDIDRPFPRTKIAELEKVLGCRLEEIWAHY